MRRRFGTALLSVFCPSLLRLGVLCLAWLFVPAAPVAAQTADAALNAAMRAAINMGPKRADMRTDTAADVAADMVWVRKSERTLHLLKDYEIIRSYPVALGKSPVGHKRAAGDSRTPEGLYLIDWRNPVSKFHLALHISYPGVNDLRRASQSGTDAGDSIMIHGQPVDERESAGFDWTDGCIALRNRDMDEVWQLVADDTPILIDP